MVARITFVTVNVDRLECLLFWCWLYDFAVMCWRTHLSFVAVENTWGLSIAGREVV